MIISCLKAGYYFYNNILFNMRVVNITSPDVNNGEGFRTTLWVAGCNHHCRGCHNPDTWEYKQGKALRDVSKDLYDKLDKSYISGLTLSGGDPLDQSKVSLIELYLLLKRIRKKFPNKNIWIYSGYTYEEILKDKFKKLVLSQCDVLVDGPYRYALRDTSLAFRGSSNQRIIHLNNE